MYFIPGANYTISCIMFLKSQHPFLFGVNLNEYWSKSQVPVFCNNSR
uniref:Uncharacterized protein n=1 Tax=Methanococcus maripaludis (strain C5 / ATCC BAA-1333) TaxID=402880 RepID=O06106_METM5|nr:unknown [Methanococcus maripaludis C5]